MADGGEDHVCGVALAAFEVAAAEVAGIDRMLLSTSMSQDLEGLAGEVDAFAARFGPLG